jgi:predicted enzyme related to lactoylglutathione lyase
MPQYPFIVIVVEDITMAMKKIADTGGEVHGYPVEIPCIGRYVAITDSEGNRVGVLEPITL